MKAELIDRMGDDLTVVNSARVSFNKQSEWDYKEAFPSGPGFPVKYDPHLSEKDQKLIKYLARNNHWTPFSHVSIQMRETVPIFIARQRFKHQIGFTYNEESRRYVSDEPSFFYPDEWRKASVDKKQGSSDELVFMTPSFPDKRLIKEQYEEFIDVVAKFYGRLIESGVAPEQARMVLPQSMYTSYYVTGSLAAWARAYKLRNDTHAQKEIQELAKQWTNIIGSIPELRYSWTALTSS